MDTFFGDYTFSHVTIALKLYPFTTENGKAKILLGILGTVGYIVKGQFTT